MQNFRLLPQVSLRQIMQLLSLMTAAILGVQWAQLHSRPLQAFLLHNWDSRKSSLNWLIQLPKGFFQSVLVEATGTSAREGRTWYSPMKITTDASLWGWGAHSGDWQAQGAWLPEEACQSSNFRELVAVGNALIALEERVNSKDLLIFFRTMPQP